jgi:hypothetical protein
VLDYAHSGEEEGMWEWGANIERTGGGVKRKKEEKKKVRTAVLPVHIIRGSRRPRGEWEDYFGKGSISNEMEGYGRSSGWDEVETDYVEESKGLAAPTAKRVVRCSGLSDQTTAAQ